METLKTPIISIFIFLLIFQFTDISASTKKGNKSLIDGYIKNDMYIYTRLDNEEKINESFKKAIANYENGIENNEVESYNGLGVTYWYAPNELRNLKLCFQNLSKAYELEQLYAYDILSWFYTVGLEVVEIDYEKAIAIINEGIDKLTIETTFINGDKISKSNKKLLPSIVNNLHFQMGIIHELGLGVPVDYKKALEAYNKIESYREVSNKLLEPLCNLDYKLKSIDNNTYNDTVAMYFDLGRLHELSRNYEIAFEAYSAGAQNGHAPSQYELAYALMTAEGCQLDKMSAFQQMQESANSGYQLGIHDLGYWYGSGIGTIQNIQQCWFWVEKAARSGFVFSQYQMGYYFESIGQFDNSYEWYKIAYNNGWVSAGEKMTSMKKWAKASKFIKPIAAMANNMAQYNSMNQTTQSNQNQGSYEGTFNSTGGSTGSVIQKGANGNYTVKAKITCNECGGSGRTDVAGITVDCPRCHGKGYIGQ